MTQPAVPTPAGWYPDPYTTDKNSARYFDGSQWTGYQHTYPHSEILPLHPLEHLKGEKFPYYQTPPDVKRDNWEIYRETNFQMSMYIVVGGSIFMAVAMLGLGIAVVVSRF